MKRKIGFTATPMPKNWVRVLYILLRRKLRKINPDLMIGIVAVVILLLQVFIIVTAVKGQERPQGLNIGDNVPDVTITNIINHPTGEAKISDFKGKLLILDFWATWCSPCVSMIPKMDSLQKQFDGKVQILPVTYQAENVLKPFFAKHKTALPQVVADQVLHQLFPHKTLPHYVWIGPDGTLLAETSYDQVTAAKLNEVLAGRKSLIAKEEMKEVAYDATQPLFTGLNGGSGAHVKYHRLISTYTEGLASGYKFSTDSNRVKITARNETLLGLFMLAFGEGRRFLNKNRVIFEGVDPGHFDSSLQGNAFLAWMRAGNVYCYELILPGVSSADAFQLMRDDLALYFTDFTVSREKRRVPCLVLAKTGNKIQESRKGQPEIRMSKTSARLRNVHLSHFIGRLDSYYLQQNKLPLVDDTGINSPVDFEIQANMTDPKSIDAALRSYGLSLKPEVREVELLVIRAKGGRS